MGLLNLTIWFLDIFILYLNVSSSNKILFNPELLSKVDKKNFSHGFVFPIPIMIAGALLLVGSVYLYYDGLWMGFFAALIIGSLLLFSYEGIEIDKKNKTFNEWSRWFGIRFGKARSLELIDSISTILETDSGKFFAITEKSPEITEDYYKVFLMSENHLHKIFICKSKKKEEIKHMAESIAFWLNLEVKPYSPKRFTH